MTSSATVTAIINSAYQAGSKFVLVRSSGSFYLTRTDTLSDDLLADIELNKEDIYIAIGGTIGEIQAAEQEAEQSDSNVLSGVNVSGLLDVLRERGVELKESDVISEETLNRHYFHFTEKVEAIADILETSIAT